jgi:uncharacterized Zn finger protein
VGFWPRYVPLALRRRRAERALLRLRERGQALSPVVLAGRTIASTFWGKSWCANLERYGDYANRLPRGRSYVRNGSVVDLHVAPGEVLARVSGSELYEVRVTIAAVPGKVWKELCKSCAGGIDSLVELLQGRFSKAVMARLCQPHAGLFPAPREIAFACSCPDVARMCKHVAAVLYGVGARLDQRPELLFTLRKVDQKELVDRAGRAMPFGRARPAPDRVLRVASLGDLFGIDIARGRPSRLHRSGGE